MTLELIETVPSLPPRPRDSNKGLFGTVLVIAGSAAWPGPPPLCGASGAAIRRRAGQDRHAGRGPADRRQLRAVVHGLSPTLR